MAYDYSNYINAANQKYGTNVSPSVFSALINSESSGQQYDKNGQVLSSSLGYKGLGQLGRSAVADVRPGATQDEITAIINDPYQNLAASADYIALLSKRYGNTRDALAHYKGAGGTDSYAYADKVLAASGDTSGQDVYLYKNAYDWIKSIVTGEPGTQTTVKKSATDQQTGQGTKPATWGKIQTYAASAGALVLGVGLLLILANKDEVISTTKKVMI